MKPTDKTNTTEIRIYQSLWKNVLLFAGCMAFAVVGCLIIRDDNCDLAKKIMGGWLNVVLFGGCGL
ncbi:STM3941 family protein [Duncaniella freteri]|uniref:STM3941 family protein n=1 Tax=Duncaniella freteri TaxID=2530391 RepID=UPI0025A93C3F|nr:STM3941 family protein [uncultured Duncaniella sp.]